MGDNLSYQKLQEKLHSLENEFQAYKEMIESRRRLKNVSTGYPIERKTGYIISTYRSGNTYILTPHS